MLRGYLLENSFAGDQGPFVLTLVHLKSSFLATNLCATRNLLTNSFVSAAIHSQSPVVLTNLLYADRFDAVPFGKTLEVRNVYNSF